LFDADARMQVLSSRAGLRGRADARDRDWRRLIVAGAERSPAPVSCAVMFQAVTNPSDQHKRVANTRFYLVRGGV